MPLPPITSPNSFPVTNPERFQVGQDVWLYAGEEDEEGRPVKSGGTIIAAFKPFVSPLQYYIIRLSNPEWPIYETRDGYMLSPAEDQEPLFVKQREAKGANPPDVAIAGFGPWGGKPRSYRS